MERKWKLKHYGIGDYIGIGFRDHGKEAGNYYIMVVEASIQILEKKMETAV